MGEDRFTDPVEGVGDNHLLPYQSMNLSEIIAPFSDGANIIYLRFSGKVNTVVGMFTDNGQDATENTGSPIYGGDVFSVSKNSLNKTKLIAVGAAVSFRDEQYRREVNY